MKHHWTYQTPNIRQTPKYADRSVEYKVNSQGYRDDEFKWLNPRGNDPYSIAIGCSHTWGIGLREDEIWLSYFKSIFCEPHKIWNLGLPGGSNDKIYRILHNILGYKMRKPESVIIQMTYPGRTEWADNNGDLKDILPSDGHEIYHRLTTDRHHNQKMIELMLFQLLTC